MVEVTPTQVIKKDISDTRAEINLLISEEARVSEVYRKKVRDREIFISKLEELLEERSNERN